jgi:hypothetical protein
LHKFAKIAQNLLNSSYGKLPNSKGVIVNYKDQPEKLTAALLELNQVKAVTTEYDYWVITLSNNLVIYLGEDFDTDGTSWNNQGSTLEGFSDHQDIAKLLIEFANWVDAL